jgi:hypothetical protein
MPLPAPSFLITIDTEGDNLWSRPREITTRNAAFLPRFQVLCERYGLKPTYLTNYEMARSPAFRELASDVLRRETGEVGMHLHAWNSPPLAPLTEDDCRFQPFLIEYPGHVMRDKIAALTDLLEDTFQVKMISHRAGRWSFNGLYARMLAQRGFLVDCSVTPTVSWKATLGDPRQQGGTDYSDFPADAYFLDLDDISRPGTSALLEIPVTIRAPWRGLSQRLPSALAQLPGLRSMARSRLWLRPKRGNRRELLRLVEDGWRERCEYLEFMLHSSEFMPGGSPNFPEERDVEALYDDLEALFERVQHRFAGRTLAEHYPVRRESPEAAGGGTTGQARSLGTLETVSARKRI